MLIYTSVFVGSVFIAQRVLRYVSENLLTIDNPYYWPVSIFGPRFPSLRDLAVAAAVTAAFFLFCHVLEVKRFNRRKAGADIKHRLSR